MKVARSSNTSLATHPTTQCHFPAKLIFNYWILKANADLLQNRLYSGAVAQVPNDTNGYVMSVRPYDRMKRRGYR